MNRAVAPLAMLLVGAILLAGSPTGAAAGYDVSLSPSVDTPTRTVTFQGNSYQVSAFGRVDPGETVSASASGPSEELYDVLLYNADQQIVDSTEATGEATVSFTTAYEDGQDYAPGTYAVAVSKGGNFEAVHPVVISGYRVSVDAPSSVEPDDQLTVDADVTTVDDAKAIDRIQVVIGNGDRERRVTLADEGGGDYGATFTLNTLPEGDYSLYVVVQGSQQALGHKEVLGVSNSQSLSISATSATETTSEGSSGGGGGTTATPPSSTPPTTGTSTTGPVTTDLSTSSTRTTVQTDVTMGTTTDGVITPNDPSTTEPSTTTPGQPLGVVTALLALLVTAIIARRRR